jgi:hypothetical protein
MEDFGLLFFLILIKIFKEKHVPQKKMNLKGKLVIL